MQVAQKQVMELTTAIKFLLEAIRLNLARSARDLNYGSKWHTLGTQENGNAEDSFAPHQAHANHHSTLADGE
jgi:hypothetical protein